MTGIPRQPRAETFGPVSVPAPLGVSIGPPGLPGVPGVGLPAIPGVGSITEGAASAIVGAIRPYLKIAAGAVGLLVTGVALVYLGGRNTGVGRAAAGVATGATTGGPAGAAIGAVAGATGAAEAAERRKALRAEVAEQRRREAREEARSRVEVAGGRVRTVSRAEGARRRSEDAEAEMERAELRAEQNRANLAALRSRTRSGPRSRVASEKVPA